MSWLKISLLTLVVSIVLSKGIGDLSHLSYFDNTFISKWEYSSAITSGFGIGEVISQKCTNKQGKNRHGWTFVVREYYQCNVAQIWLSDIIYGVQK